ncbi:MAG: bifunctional phosphoglucose/phosphomannose isomerase [Methanobacteriota archaeon]|nr:MAG: bifunctional phosphoglucose/phosphomannose isomerase [Euryarchaeota archaeon]TLZ94657.1 MAG: bifunctional phosphoglucose/phosphomannose isomerase [Euryarchaeota archaeon]
MLDARAVAAVDPGGMREIIASLPDQLSAGMKVGESTRVPIEEAQRIFIVGMGGSAIGGDVFASWIADRAKVPIQVVRDYRIPAYGRPEDLLIAVSYSGNTEETLAATTQGLKLGCRVVAITSGGTLRDLVRANDMRVLPVPTGLPPRGAFGHLFGILSGIGGEWAIGNLTDELGQAINHLRSLRKALRPESGVRSNRAKSLALRIRSTVPVTYGAGPFVAIARRWQTQLNENAKVLAFSSTFPEADHNELVGWVEDARARTHRAILLRDRDEAPDLRRQLDITVSLMSRKAKVEQVHDEGPTLVSRMLGTLYLGDYVSLYLAVLRRVDPLVLKPIQTLKAKLAESHRKG